MVVVDEENILRIFIMCVNIKIISFSFRLRINLIHVCKSTFALIYWHIKYFIYIHEFVYVCVCARLCTRSRKNECWKKIGKIKELQRGKSSHTTHAISYDSYRARTPFWLQFFKSLFLHTTRFFDYMAISVMFMCVDVFFFSISKKKLLFTCHSSIYNSFYFRVWWFLSKREVVSSSLCCCQNGHAWHVNSNGNLIMIVLF